MLKWIFFFFWKIRPRIKDQMPFSSHWWNKQGTKKILVHLRFFCHLQEFQMKPIYHENISPELDGRNLLRFLKKKKKIWVTWYDTCMIFCFQFRKMMKFWQFWMVIETEIISNVASFEDHFVIRVVAILHTILWNSSPKIRTRDFLWSMVKAEFRKWNIVTGEQTKLVE